MRSALGLLLAAALPSLAFAQPTPKDSELGPQQKNTPPAATDAQTPDAAPKSEPPPKIETWALHGQVTDIYQYHPAFPSAFQGPQSFDHKDHTGNTLDLTLYAGVRPWRGAELWVNPELYQGHAPNDTLGLAGYVNGDGAKVGKNHPYSRIARLFLRQTFDLGGGTESVDPDLNQLGGAQAKDRVVVTFGKFNATDVFDANKYAHDPRHDFLNWSAIDAGSFDYAADAWGYSYGLSGEWRTGDWTGRLGLFDLSIIPNNKTLTPDLSQFQILAEVERRYSLNGRGGAARITGFLSRGNMGRYADAVALAQATGERPDTGLVRRYRDRPGVHLNLEQEVSDGVGIFGRLGWADGGYETYEYTDIDRTAEAGVSLEGKLWGRKDDAAGLAAVANQISKAARRYFDAGGLGVLIGDGRLPRRGPEQILEGYYSVAVGIARVSLDWQFFENPAYNRDRGPVNVLGLRIHLQH